MISIDSDFGNRFLKEAFLRAKLPKTFCLLSGKSHFASLRHYSRKAALIASSRPQRAAIKRNLLLTARPLAIANTRLLHGV